MRQLRAAPVLRRAGWCLSLLMLLSAVPSLSDSPPRGPSANAGPPLAPLQAMSQRRQALDATAAVTPVVTPSSLPPPTAAPPPAAEPAAAAQPAAIAPDAEPPPAEVLAAAPPMPIPDGPAMTEALLFLANDLRASYGLPPLAADPALAAASADYALLMALNNWFSHEGPDGSTFISRAEAAGYTGWTYVAENLYRGPAGDPASAIMELWASSPPHLSELLSPQAAATGVGCYVSGDWRWCVQEFGAR